jgi:hypothetical protein
MQAISWGSYRHQLLLYLLLLVPSKMLAVHLTGEVSGTAHAGDLSSAIYRTTAGIMAAPAGENSLHSGNTKGSAEEEHEGRKLGKLLPFPLARTQGGRAYPTMIDISKPPYNAIGDNVTDNSAAFRAAISALGEAGGGTLVVPHGRFRTGPLSLASNTTLELRRGSVVAAPCDVSWSLEPSAMPGQTPWGGLTGAFISAVNASDVVISGEGTIDGCGSAFWRAMGGNSSADRAWKAAIPGFNGHGNRPFLLRLENSQRLRVEGVTLQNSPFWTFVPFGSTDVHIDGITISNPSGGHGLCYDKGGWDPDLPYDGDNLANCCAANTDGIDITSCNRVLIENSKISTGDDCVCMKNRGYGTVAVPTKDVLVRNMSLLSCSCPTRGHDGVGAFKLGTQLEGGVSEVVFEDSWIGRAGYALKLDSPFGQMGYARNVTWRNISITEAEQAIFINAAGITARPHPPTPPPVPGANCTVTIQTQLSRSACIEGKTFGCFGNGSMWAGPSGCGALFVCDNASGVKCGGNWYAREICPCVTTRNVFINVSDLRFIDIVGNNIGEPREDGSAGSTINQIRASSPLGATGMVFRNISLTGKNVSWQVEGMRGESIDVFPPLVLDRLADDETHLECADLTSAEQMFSSYWGSHHFLRYKDISSSMTTRSNDAKAPTSLGIPALGYRMYSDRSLDLHHGAGLWLSLLKLGVKKTQFLATDFSVADSKYEWRPDFVQQSGEIAGCSVSQQVYYSDMNTIQADFIFSQTRPHSSIELHGIPNPANTFVRTHELGWKGAALQLGVVLSTNLTHGAGGTAAGCIAAKACEPITLHAVVSVSVSVSGCSDDTGCGNLSVSSICSSPPSPPQGAQCKLTQQGSRLPCVQHNLTNPTGNFGCFPENHTMWLSDHAGECCRGVFDCAGVSGVNCPGTGKLIGDRMYCDCLPPPPERSCNYTFTFHNPEYTSVRANTVLHAQFQFVNESTFSKMLHGILQPKQLREPIDHGHALARTGPNRTTAVINAWLREAKPLPVNSPLDAHERLMYYRAWLNYWIQIQHGTGNLTGKPVISSSKSEYGRNNALWDTGCGAN